MQEILTKISRYNLFNYGLTGAVFIIFIIFIFKPESVFIIQQNVAIFLLISYFTGSILSRLGSLCIEPLLEKTRFVIFANYTDFLNAKKIDSTINDLSEENNTYRTYIMSFFILFILMLIKILNYHIPISRNSLIFITIILLLVLFLFSYRKQTSYIRKSVNHLNKNL